MLTFPDMVQTHLRLTYGQPQAVDVLRGLSHAQVWRVRFQAHSVIIKRTATRNEYLFYHTVAPRLRPYGIPIPVLEWSAEVSDGTWLLLEDIPLPFPQTRWVADAEQLAILRRLHHTPISLAHGHVPLFCPQWTQAMTEDALACFPRSTAADLRPILTTLQDAAQTLFTPSHLISGDPNPKNWGMRQDETLALFDWERFGCATPVIDVAITVPSLGERATMQRVAAAYLETDDRAMVAAFTQDIALAKVWSVVELLAELHTRDAQPDELFTYLCTHVPAWLHAIANAHS